MRYATIMVSKESPVAVIFVIYNNLTKGTVKRVKTPLRGGAVATSNWCPGRGHFKREPWPGTLRCVLGQEAL